MMRLSARPLLFAAYLASPSLAWAGDSDARAWQTLCFSLETRQLPEASRNPELSELAFFTVKAWLDHDPENLPFTVRQGFGGTILCGGAPADTFEEAVARLGLRWQSLKVSDGLLGEARAAAVAAYARPAQAPLKTRILKALFRGDSCTDKPSTASAVPNSVDASTIERVLAPIIRSGPACFAWSRPDLPTHAIPAWKTGNNAPVNCKPDCTLAPFRDGVEAIVLDDPDASASEMVIAKLHPVDVDVVAYQMATAAIVLESDGLFSDGGIEPVVDDCTQVVGHLSLLFARSVPERTAEETEARATHFKELYERELTEAELQRVRSHALGALDVLTAQTEEVLSARLVAERLSMPLYRLEDQRRAIARVDLGRVNRALSAWAGTAGTLLVARTALNHAVQAAFLGWPDLARLRIEVFRTTP
jgi:hypothetical protein